MAHPADTVAPAAKKAGLMDDLVDVFVKPRAMFDRNRNEGFVRPALVQSIFFLVVAVAALSLISPYFEAEMIRGMRQSGQQMPENAAGMMGTMATVTTVAGSALAPWFIAILGGIAVWIGAKIAGAALSFKQAAMVSAWSYAPAMIGMVVLAVQGAVLDTTNLKGVGDGQLGPARFVDPYETPKVLYGLYQQLDVFNLWGLLLTALGVAVVARKELGTGILAAVIKFALVASISIIPALLQGG